MSRPISLCLERRAHDCAESYVRCTATSGRESGLSIAANGDILWRDPTPCVCELWVSRDQRLMAMRPGGAPSICLHRGRRKLEIPEGRAVVVLDQDELKFGSEHFIVHVHGVTDEVHPPQPLRAARIAAAAAVALSIGCGDGESPTSFTPFPNQSSQQGGAPVVPEVTAGVGGGPTDQLGSGGMEVRIPIPLGRAGAAGEIEVVNTPPL